MDVLLVPLGSAGDIHPFVGLGLALRARGHRVAVISEPSAKSIVGATGLDFLSLGGWKDARSARGPLRSVLRPPGGRWRRLARASTVLSLLRPVYKILAERYVPGQTVVAASSLALGARVAQEKLGLPLATVHLAPWQFRSVYRAPAQPPLRLPDWAPTWSKRAAYWLLDALVLDPLVAGPINAFRAELGLLPVRRLFADWRHSPQRVIGLFPDWFGQPQPDWPAETRLTGFPCYDESGPHGLPREAEEFLTRGAAPIVFTAGSAVRRCREFFAESVAACRRLGCRALLLTRFRDQVPPDLPSGIRHFDYLPFSRVLPRAAVLVHPGGIGTAAQGLAAGVPQLLVPRKNDQPDNARRLAQLGITQVLSPRAYRASTVARTLVDLLTDTRLASRCAALRRRLIANDAVAQTCRLIEDLPRSAPAAAA
jgi:UDP:flavonoid glycosyltransferase YjiC (YdhE family)